MDIIIYVDDPVQLRILVELYIKNGANIKKEINLTLSNSD